ncbi:MAG: plasmid pRiA4b ORF-3 family protein [Planctomycetes bacterium]|nr:plasmid pRiA4b ORF-3 family protein [Planctomycetota bacterium]
MTSRKRRKAGTPACVHELRITLQGSKPAIWRRVAVASDTTLGGLHEVIQVVMGWTNSHLHQFVVRNDQPKPTREEIRKLGQSGQWEKIVGRRRRDRTISDPEFKLEDAEDEFAVRLAELAPRVGSGFAYEYDFGDGWAHRVEVVKIGPPDKGVEYPICLAGKLARPPEDCGGVWSYYDLLGAIRNPRHARHDERVEWLGDDFDPDRFDLEEVNAVLSDLR